MTCSHMSYFFISKQLLWELFFRISNSKRLRAYTLKANSTLTIELEYDTCYFLVTTGISNNDIPPLTTNVYTVTVAAKTRSSDVSIIHSDISNIEVSIEGNKLTLCSTA